LYIFFKYKPFPDVREREMKESDRERERERQPTMRIGERAHLPLCELLSNI